MRISGGIYSRSGTVGLAGGGYLPRAPDVVNRIGAAADLRASRPSRKLCDAGHSLAVTMDLTVRDLAKLLKVSENTVYRWIEKDDLPAYRLHEQYRLNRVELQEWVA